jgi:hypothetical protein
MIAGMAAHQRPRRAGTRGWVFWVVLALATVAASSTAIVERTPRFLVPAIGVIGAVLVTAALVKLLIRLRRTYREAGVLGMAPLLVMVVAFVFVVIVPAIHLHRAFMPSHDRPRILAGFDDWFGAEGYPLLGRHRGIDIKGAPGADVLAAADGRVAVARDDGDLCGLIVVIDHPPSVYRTVYCHFSEIAVRVGDTVKRGQRIGAIGTSGRRAWPGYEHVHLEVQRGRDVDDLVDPMPSIVGCFDKTKSYDRARLVLTYPVKC